MEALLKYVRQVIPLEGDAEEKILARTRSRKFLKGQYLVQSGDICRNEYFVLSGCLRTFYVDHDGQEHIVMFAIENWWTGDLGSFITQTPSDFNVQCLENTEVAYIAYEDLEMLYHEVPLMERFFRIIIQKAFVASQKRIVQSFSLPAKERYIQFRQRYPLIEQRVPQYMIASYLGITKEFLSKIRGQLMLDQ